MKQPASVLFVFGVFMGSHAIAQEALWTNPTGVRASEIVGSTVLNDANEIVGAVDELIVATNGHAPFAILSVGAFVGQGTKYVIFPLTSLQVRDKSHIIFPGATKDSLNEVPDYRYASWQPR
jgi:hypothetical protein